MAAPGEKFKDFYDALAHGNEGGHGMNRYVFFDCRINTARAVVRYKLNNNQPVTFDVENIPEEKHAEEVAIETLTEKIIQVYTTTGQRVNVEVKIYINFSPCQDCSEKLLEFMSLPQAQNVRMTIIFAALYNIVRKTCLESCITDRLCRKHVQYFFDNGNPLDSVTNRQGMRNLYAAEGVFLRPFDAENWLFVLNHFFPVGGADLLENAIAGIQLNANYGVLQQRLDGLHIFGVNLTVQQREREDQRQRKDLDDIIAEREVTKEMGLPVNMIFFYPEPVVNPITLRWYKRRQDAMPLEFVPQAINNDAAGNPVLQLNQVSQADAGEYFGIAELQNHAKVYSYTVKLTVEVTAAMGQPFTMTLCYPDNMPVHNPITLRWFKRRQGAIPVAFVPPPDMINNAPGNLVLQFNEVSQADGGEYFCIAELQDHAKVYSYTVKLTIVQADDDDDAPQPDA